MVYMSKPLLILENIRSSYNTWNMLRTADALWWGVVLSGFTPDPLLSEKVSKTALGAEHTTIVYKNRNTTHVLSWLREQWLCILGSELTQSSRSVRLFSDDRKTLLESTSSVALIMWNEKTWLLQETRWLVNGLYHIPMIGIKESLNVWQAAAIMMWEINRVLWY